MRSVGGWALVVLLSFPGAAPLLAVGEAAEDLRAARQLFEKNLDAIRRRDKPAYLACYLDGASFARSGPDGTSLGFADFQKQAGGHWPDTFVADDARFVLVIPGIVYGTYRYRVRYGTDEQAGLSERVFVKTPSGWRIGVTTAFESPAGTPPPPRAVVGGTLVDGTGAAPVPDSVVLIRDGKIECVGMRSECPVIDGYAVSDAAGLFVTPGLVDAHVHFSQTGWADGRPDAMDVRATHPYEKTQGDLKARPERFFRSYVCSGVTAVFDVGGYAWSLKLGERAEKDTRAPHVVAAGPLLSTLDHWLNLPAERQFIHLKDEESGRDGVRYLASQGSRAVKVWYIVSKELTVQASAGAVKAVGDEAKKLGLPMIVHATGLAEAKAALRAGASLLVHSVWDEPVDGELLDLLKANGAIYCPTLTVPAGYTSLRNARDEHRIPFVDDPNGCVDKATLALIAETASLDRGEPKKAPVRTPAATAREKTMAENLLKVRDAGITIAMGTDAGNPMTLHGPSVYAEMEAMQRAGMTPMEVLVASTRGGSRAMGRPKEIGTLEKGKLADLLLLAGDPTRDIANLRKVKHVMRGGVIRSIEELHTVASAASAASAP